MDFMDTRPIESHWESMAHTCISLILNDTNIDIHPARVSKHTILGLRLQQKFMRES